MKRYFFILVPLFLTTTCSPQVSDKEKDLVREVLEILHAKHAHELEQNLLQTTDVFLNILSTQELETFIADSKLPLLEKAHQNYPVIQGKIQQLLSPIFLSTLKSTLYAFDKDPLTPMINHITRQLPTTQQPQVVEDQPCYNQLTQESVTILLQGDNEILDYIDNLCSQLEAIAYQVKTTHFSKKLFKSKFIPALRDRLERVPFKNIAQITGIFCAHFTSREIQQLADISINRKKSAITNKIFTAYQQSVRLIRSKNHCKANHGAMALGN